MIESWTPDARRFRIDPGATTNFSVTAFDPDGDDLWFYWDVAKQTAEGWSWFGEIESDETFSFDSSAYGEGRYYIECQVSDNWYSDWKSWTITVAEKTPLAFVTDAVLPTARAGYYWQEVKISGGEEPYAVEIATPDTWPDWLDSDYLDHRDEWGYDNPVLDGYPDNDDVGTYSFALRVTDAEGRSIEQAFTVAVVSNSAPVIESWTPQASRFRIDPGAVTNFSVAATDPDGDDLSFRWRVYRQSSSFWAWEYWEDGSESDRFTFRSSRYGEGLYRIEAEADDGVYSEHHTWIVSVARDRPFAIMTEQSLPSGKAYWYYQQDLQIVGGAEPYVVEIVDRNLGADWLHVDRWQDSWGNVFHVLSGTPYSDDVGSHSFSLRVTAAKGTSVEKTFTLEVQGNPNQMPPADQPPSDSAVKSYAIAFAANGGKGMMAAQTVVRNATAKLAANRFARSGWVFLGWARTAGGAVAYANGATVKNLAAAGKTVTLYAKWAKKSYKVKFYANGGKGKMKVQAMTYGKAKKLSANKFKREGYVFKGWATSKSNARKGKVKYKNKKSVKNLVMNGKTVKLYAVWKKQ